MNDGAQDDSAVLHMGFRGLEVPHGALVQALSMFSEALEDHDFRFLPEALPLPEDGQPLLELWFEGPPGEIDHDMARALAGTLARSLPRGTPILLPES